MYLVSEHSGHFCIVLKLAQILASTCFTFFPFTPLFVERMKVLEYH